MAPAKGKVKVRARVLAHVDQASTDKKVIVPETKLAPMKLQATLDPTLTALVQRLKAISQETGHGPGSIRIMPKSMPTSHSCACGCSCCC
jgi:hypothetical protein